MLPLRSGHGRPLAHLATGGGAQSVVAASMFVGDACRRCAVVISKSHPMLPVWSWAETSTSRRTWARIDRLHPGRGQDAGAAAPMPSLVGATVRDREAGQVQGRFSWNRVGQARLAIGAQFIRDMIVDAWAASATGMVGYPMVNVRDIESGKVRATRELMGAD
jgi:hypothetical protein